MSLCALQWTGDAQAIGEKMGVIINGWTDRWRFICRLHSNGNLSNAKKKKKSNDLCQTDSVKLLQSLAVKLRCELKGSFECWKYF